MAGLPKCGAGPNEREIDPITVRVPEALAMTGFKRSRLYELIKSGEIQIAKDGHCTLIVVDSLKDAIKRRIVER